MTVFEWLLSFLLSSDDEPIMQRISFCTLVFLITNRPSCETCCDMYNFNIYNHCKPHGSREATNCQIIVFVSYAHSSTIQPLTGRFQVNMLPLQEPNPHMPCQVIFWPAMANLDTSNCLIRLKNMPL